ncbi:putative lipid-transfer protein DIR1 [Trifolium pratense]|uniref:putative lipid-transfer protein DIR1 n=1 Tax=Trifolium pratense TaxID=57577 RepID=UPI001E69782B|nr:putative lipid-transfer protein DIR1 [Trifolium pratense]
MAQINVNVLIMNLLVFIALLITLFSGTKAIVICDINTDKLDVCKAAIIGKHPPKPNTKCCGLIKKADLDCLCRYKSLLSALGINPTKALALPRKCGLKTPPGCRET